MSALLLNNHNNVDMKNDNEQSKKINVPIFRFKFSDIIMEQLSYFAELHKNENRVDFKESWNTWLEENNTLIKNEETRLTNLGFNGNIEDKMYKSVRYYFCKKSNETKEPKKRGVYIGISPDIIFRMDEHIDNYVLGINNRNAENTENAKNDENTTTNKKPANAYKEFYDSHTDLIQKEQQHLSKTYNIKKDDFDLKMKKTYKNRYFIKTK
jgi:hypothetical protein